MYSIEFIHIISEKLKQYRLKMIEKYNKFLQILLFNCAFILIVFCLSFIMKINEINNILLSCIFIPILILIYITICNIKINKIFNKEEKEFFKLIEYNYKIYFIEDAIKINENEFILQFYRSVIRKYSFSDLKIFFNILENIEDLEIKKQYISELIYTQYSSENLYQILLRNIDNLSEKNKLLKLEFNKNKELKKYIEEEYYFKISEDSKVKFLLTIEEILSNIEEKNIVIELNKHISYKEMVQILFEKGKNKFSNNEFKLKLWIFFNTYNQIKQTEVLKLKEKIILEILSNDTASIIFDYRKQVLNLIQDLNIPKDDYRLSNLKLDIYMEYLNPTRAIEKIGNVVSGLFSKEKKEFRTEYEVNINYIDEFFLNYENNRSMQDLLNIEKYKNYVINNYRNNLLLLIKEDKSQKELQRMLLLNEDLLNEICLFIIKNDLLLKNDYMFFSQYILKYSTNKTLIHFVKTEKVFSSNIFNKIENKILINV